MAQELLENQQESPQRRCTACLQEFDAETAVCPDDGTALVPIPHDELDGTVFAERYEIVSLIGKGGMGKVYKAQHKLMKRLVAIKVVHAQLVSNSLTMARFRQEAETASSLNHPNIVAVHDFGLLPRAYLVMAYLEGISLADLLLNDACLSIDRCLPIFVQICAGLAHAHQHGVVHRDLKPSNIMLISEDGQADFVKIVDFGIAKLMQAEGGKSVNLTATGEIFGSPLYMSPEQCRGKFMDARSDIYSLGCIMYRTLTGHQPIPGQDLLECSYNHVNLAPRSFKDTCPHIKIPEELEAIVIKCMEKKKEKRFQSMLELKNALEALGILGDATPLKKLIQQNANRTSIAVAMQLSEQAPIEITNVDASITEAGRAAFAAEAGRIAFAVEAGLVAFAAEAGRAASAVEDSLARSAAESERAASAAESGRAAFAAESARATSAAEAERAASAAEAERAASAAEAGLAAFAAEAGRAASAAEASLIASAAEAATAYEVKRAVASAEPGNNVTDTDISFSRSEAESERSASAAEANRAASAAECSRAAAAAESARVASAIEAAFAASAKEARLAASAHEARLAASALEAGRAASAAEAGRAASAAEAGRAASAAEAERAASAAEVGRAASAAEASRVATAAEAGRAASSTNDQEATANDTNGGDGITS